MSASTVSWGSEGGRGCIITQYSTVQYSTVQQSTVQYSTVQMQYSTAKCSAAQYSTIQCSTAIHLASSLLLLPRYTNTITTPTVTHCCVQQGPSALVIAAPGLLLLKPPRLVAHWRVPRPRA